MNIIPALILLATLIAGSEHGTRYMSKLTTIPVRVSPSTLPAATSPLVAAPIDPLAELKAAAVRYHTANANYERLVAEMNTNWEKSAERANLEKAVADADSVYQKAWSANTKSSIDKKNAAHDALVTAQTALLHAELDNSSPEFDAVTRQLQTAKNAWKKAKEALVADKKNAGLVIPVELDPEPIDSGGTDVNTENVTDPEAKPIGRFKAIDIYHVRLAGVQEMNSKIAKSKSWEESEKLHGRRLQIINMKANDIAKLMVEQEDANERAWKEYKEKNKRDEDLVSRIAKYMVRSGIVRSAHPTNDPAQVSTYRDGTVRVPTTFEFVTESGLIREYEGWIQVCRGDHDVQVPDAVCIDGIESRTLFPFRPYGTQLPILEHVMSQITLYGIDLTAQPPQLTPFKRWPYVENP